MLYVFRDLLQRLRKIVDLEQQEPRSIGRKYYFSNEEEDFGQRNINRGDSSGMPKDIGHETPKVHIEEVPDIGKSLDEVDLYKDSYVHFMTIESKPANLTATTSPFARLRSKNNP